MNDQWMNQKIEEQLSKLTLEEKAELLSGKDFWTTKENKKIGLTSITMTDGPHGLRKQIAASDHLGMNESAPATCFPTACALASSWNPQLANKIGQALAEECKEAGIDILLGPGVNMKRSPLGGRNFEYLSEDPCQASEMAIGYIKGLQDNGIGVSLKHFAANNQETERMVSDSVVDERTLRELYLAVFENIVKRVNPWTIMCSYNKLNGSYTSEHRWLLSDVLKKEWQYDGVVISDWGAVNEKADSVINGLDLEMPGTNESADQELEKAVKAGIVPMSKVDDAVIRILRLHMRLRNGQEQKEKGNWKENHTRTAWKEHHKLARQAAAECIVLLKNDGNTLPLQKEEKIAVLGKMAVQIRCQGNGSSLVNPYETDCPLDELRRLASEVSYAEGYETETTAKNEELLKEAVEIAGRSDKIVLFVGYPEFAEKEGCDKVSMRLPENQIALIEETAKLGKKIVLVMSNGSPVEMPFLGKADAVLETYLGGEAVGGAVADVLFGNVNPSGKLAETFPKKLEDTPSYLNFPGMYKKTYYAEGIFMGYRYYDTKEIEPLFPFGHGLSYTSFVYHELTVKDDRNSVVVELEIENTGKTAGAEVVQIYVEKTETKIIRARKELKGFQKVWLEPGEKKKVQIVLNERAFQYFDTENSRWHTEPGIYKILAGSSSRDIRQEASVTRKGEAMPETPLDKNSTLSDICKYSTAKERLEKNLKICEEEGYPVFVNEPEFIQNAYETTPLRWLHMLSAGHFSKEMMEEVLECTR